MKLKIKKLRAIMSHGQNLVHVNEPPIPALRGNPNGTREEEKSWDTTSSYLKFVRLDQVGEDLALHPYNVGRKGERLAQKPSQMNIKLFLDLTNELKLMAETAKYASSNKMQIK